MKYKADKIPQHTLMIKYLRKILSKRELTDLIRRYVAVKKQTLEAAHPKKL